ncbi:hypothetical protein EUGRSUZ_E03989 [Eucalyptus grandis]|uniref:F-box associated beta-propeller type 3 domain-containing protein n=2 Tax=Eucalyptus grandis TaxID=71139 RepID=A0A059CAL8_EUCGR|nr:hypothetical protein EUGRSUZ_E03989 [Eucalyptus grandis]
MGVYLHGRLYWIMRRKGVRNSAKVLVAFDIRTESFVEVDLPNVIDNRLRMDLAALPGRLCLIVYREPRVVDVWFLRVYILHRPWAPLFSLRDHWWSCRPIQLLAYSEDGSQVLVQVSSTTLGWYNLETGGVKPFHINGVPPSSATCLPI